MGRAARMHINCRAGPSRTGGFGKAPRGAGVVKMDVTEENMANISRCEASFAKIDNDIIERRFRPGIQKRYAIVRFECSRGDNAGPTELSGVKHMNVHERLLLDAATM